MGVQCIYFKLILLVKSCIFAYYFSLLPKGAFKYYVIKEVGGWVGQMMMFDDKVGGWEWLNDDVIKKYTIILCAQKKRLEFS